MHWYRFRQLFASTCRRAVRWEFWPVWLFYIPIVIYIVAQVVRYRSLAFTAVNPGMPGSGVIGEKKSQSLLCLQAACPTHVAKTACLLLADSVDARCAQCQGFMAENQLTYPIILKPDNGQRGLDVAIIEGDSAMVAYLQQAQTDIVVQEYVAGVEFGVFFIRAPKESQGFIFSLTHKCFPFLTGDGKRNLEQLICEHPRLHYMAKWLLNQHRSRLHHIPLHGEKVAIIQLGSHCRGALFLNGQRYLTPELFTQINHVSAQLPGFYFGRYDVRAKDTAAFEQGQFKVIEVNGVTSEATHIYDPTNSLFSAYKTVFQQWRWAFKIGQQNIEQGHRAMTVRQLIQCARGMNHGVNV